MPTKTERNFGLVRDEEGREWQVIYLAPEEPGWQCDGCRQQRRVMMVLPQRAQLCLGCWSERPEARP